MTQTPNQIPRLSLRRAGRLGAALAASAMLALGGGSLAQAMPGSPGLHGGGPGMPADMPAGMGRHDGGGMGLMMGDARHLARALDSVGASAEQKAQIAKIFEAARTELRAQREGGQALQAQARSLLTQPTIDARAAEALRQQMLARHDQASKRMLQATLEAAQVLTPEQRQKLAARMAQHREMMQRHRAERQTLEKAPR